MLFLVSPALGSPVALDDPAAMVTFSFAELDGNYTADVGDGSALFTAVNDLDASGQLNRLVDPAGTAVFDPGQAGFAMSLPIHEANGVWVTAGGTLSMFDADGDQISTAVDGVWLEIGGSTSFSGTVRGVSPMPVGNGILEGTDGTGFSMDFSAHPQPYQGSLITLVVGGQFVHVPENREHLDTFVAGAIVPEPMTWVLLLSGGLVCMRRPR
jgi:hypothetical protein